MSILENLTCRSEQAEDCDTVRAVNDAAFGRPDEAELVDRLQIEGVVLASFVAVCDKRIVGHVLFSRMLIDSAHSALPAVALAPVAIAPEHQRLGVGALLIQYGLDWLRAQGERIVIVLGDPNYYPRFGFSCERARAIESPFPPQALMALELVPGALDGVRGRVRYPKAFGLRDV